MGEPRTGSPQDSLGAVLVGTQRSARLRATHSAPSESPGLLVVAEIGVWLGVLGCVGLFVLVCVSVLLLE